MYASPSYHRRCLLAFACLFLVLVVLGSVAAFAQNLDAEDRDHPAEREQWFMKGRLYKGHPAPELLQKAQQQRDALRRRAYARAQANRAESSILNPQLGGGSSSTSVWTELGPAPMRSVSISGDDGDYGLVTGRATAVAVDQNDPTGNTVYLGGATGGLWKSTSAANPDPSKVSWQPIIDDQPTIAVGAIAVQPGHGNIVLVGTGEANSSADSYYGLGILRSTDAGNSWTLITSADAGVHPFHGLAFSKIAFSTDNPSIVIAAAAGASEGIAVGAEVPKPGDPPPVRGLYYSYDSGQTWSLATTIDSDGSQPQAGSVSSVVYNAAEHKFYAAFRAHGFFSSADGITWTQLANQPSPALNLANCPATTNLSTCPLYRGEIAVVPGRDEMYVWFVDSQDPPADGGIYLTKNGGQTWTAINVAGIENCGDTSGCLAGHVPQGDYNLELAAIPNGGATDLYAGAINIYRCQITTANPTCSAQPFVNLTHVYGCTPSGSFSHVHPDQHAIDFLQSNPNLMFFANDGGVYRTLAALYGAAVPTTCPLSAPAQPFYPFDNLNATMGSMTQFVWFTQHPTDQYTFLGGTQDNGSPAIDLANAGANGTTWRAVLGGDGGWNDINPGNPNEWFASNTRVSVQRCTLGTSCTDSNFSTVISSNTVGGDYAAFYMPFLLDPQNPSQIILGTCRVWRVGGTGSNAVALSQKFDGSGGTVACASTSPTLITALAAGGPAGSAGSQVIYAGTGDGRIFVTTTAANYAQTWAEVSNNSGYSNTSFYPVSGIAIDLRDGTGKTAYVTVQGFLTPHVFQTTDAGATWTDITGNLPDAPADAVTIDASSGTIYVGTDTGVYSATPNGLSTQWTEVGPATGAGALPNVAVTHVAIFNPPGQPPRLRASTYGRGVWEMPLPGSASPDFSLTIPTVDLVTYPGQNVSFSGTLTALNGYSNPVTLSCTSASSGSGGIIPQTCTGNPWTTTPSASGSPISVTVANPTVQDFAFRIQASDANGLVRQASVGLQVVDFVLGAPQPASVTDLVHGNSATVQTNVTSLGSFNSQVQLTCSGMPAGMTCNAAPITPPIGGSITATFTISTQPTLASGTYDLTLSATSADGRRTMQQHLSVTVLAGADFSLGAPTFTSPTRKPGEPLSATITLTAHDNYSGTVALACTASGAGIPTSACSFSPDTVTLGTSAVPVALTIPTTGAAAASSQITVQATDGTSTHTASLPFSIIDYSLTNVTAPGATAPGSTATFSFQLLPLNGYNQSVAFTCDTSSLGQSISCSFNPASPVTLSPGTTTLVTGSLVIPAGIPQASYSIGIRTNDAAFPTLAHAQSTGTFQVSSPADYQLAATSPDHATVTAGQSTSTTVTVNPVNGFNSPVTLQIGGCPQKATCTFAGGTISIVVTPNGEPATATLNVVTTAPSIGALQNPFRQHGTFALWLGASFGALGLLGVRRERGKALLAIGACALMLGMAACGGGSGGSGGQPPQPIPGTPAGTYTITVTATTSGSAVNKQQTTNFALTVQ